MYNVFNILGQNQHWQINKTITRMVGIHATLLLSDLVSKRQWFIQNGDIKSTNEWFFNTVENIELDTTLTPHEQRKALKILLDNAMVKTKQMGVPKRRFYMINDYYLSQIMVGNPRLTPFIKDFNDKWLKNLTTSGENFEPLINKIKQTTSKEQIKKPTVKKNKALPPPTIEELTEYFTNNGYSKESAQKAFNYYQASLTDGGKVWRDGRGNVVKNWKQKMQSVWFKDEHKIKNQQAGKLPPGKFYDHDGNIIDGF